MPNSTTITSTLVSAPASLIFESFPYERQFKGAPIGVLELPADLQNANGELPSGSWQELGFGCLHSLFCNADSMGEVKYY